MIIRLRRVLLVGVILVCLVTLALAMTGHFKPPAPPEPPRAQPGESPVHKGKLDFESQHFREFNLPRTDETGRRESIIEGEYAILQKNRYYEITQPRITVFGSPKTKPGDPQAVIITAHKATLDKITQAGTLEGGVVMQEAVPDGQSAVPKPDGTRAATDKLDYIPERKRVATDSPVALTSKGIRVNGRGLEADTVAETITLKHDVEVELEGVEGGFFAAAQGKPGGRKPRPPKPDPPDLVRIACGGSLLYQRGPNVATFSDGVKATRGESSLTSDQMVVFIDAQTRKVSKLDATGNVKVVDVAQQGAGAKLNWDAQAQTGLLAGDPARLFMKGTTLEAKKITFNQKENKITTEGGGHLVATAKPPASAGQKPSAKTPADDKVDVVWQGNMIFDGARHTAVFYDAVQLTRATGKLDCQRLELVLDEQHEQVKKLVATDKVRMVDADKEAEGDELLWNADDQTGVLSSRSAARVKQGNVSLSAQRMNLDERNSNLTTQGGGEAHVTPANPPAADTPDQAEEIDIRWKDSMVMESARKMATFHGDVSAVKGASKIRSETMHTYFDDQRKLTRIIADKAVAIASPGQEGAGDHFEWDVKSQVMTLTGSPSAKVASGNRVLICEKIMMYQAEDRAEGEGVGHLEVRQAPRPAADPAQPVKPKEPEAVVDWDKRMSFANRENKATFVGNVRVSREDASLSADTLDVFFENERVKRVLAAGNVAIKDPQTEGYGSQVTWEWQDDIAVLTGNPEAETRQKGLCTFAEKITYLRKTNEIRWEGQRPPRFKTLPDRLREQTGQPPK